MPGIIGCLQSTGDEAELKTARELLTYYDYYRQDSIYQDGWLLCTRTHLNTIGMKNSPTQQDKLFCWVEGTFYPPIVTPADVLLQAYVDGQLSQKLASIDGFFNAVLYDQERRQLYLIGDRLGMKSMYYYFDGQHLAWSAEIKGLLAMAKVDREVDREAAACFAEVGHFLGNQSLFKHIKRLPPATILRIDLPSLALHFEYYWRWSAIESVDCDFPTAVEETYRLWQAAVERRDQGVGPKSVALSGGLDSRAVVAALEGREEKGLLTFGQPTCLDGEIAKRVAERIDWAHVLYPIRSDNWLKGRVEGIWKSDGAISMINLHASQHHEAMAEWGKEHFNGFAGDLIMGGSWLNKAPFPNTALNDPYLATHKTDPYFLHHRVRRFTAEGIQEVKAFETHLPFIDHALLRFLYGLPDTYRANNRLYQSLLLRYYPHLFQTIPWAKTGFPLGKTALRYTFWQRLQRKITYYQKGLSHTYYADYAHWFSAATPLFRRILTNKNALYPHFLPSPILLPDDYGINHNYLSNLLTLEIYLQQVFNNRLKDSQEWLRNV